MNRSQPHLLLKQIAAAGVAQNFALCPTLKLRGGRQLGGNILRALIMLCADTVVARQTGDVLSPYFPILG